MKHAAHADDLPESLSPRDLGWRLAALRAKFNLTPQQVSERLHIRTRYIVAIEDGQFDLLPGKVYVRGYIQSYCEFLGVDADAYIDRCYGAETAAPVEKLPQTRAKPPLDLAQWRSRGIAAVVGLVLLLIITQLMGASSDEPIAEENSVAAVPEALLDSVRKSVMPISDNFNCLMKAKPLACFYADSTTRSLVQLDEEKPRFMGDIKLPTMEFEVGEANKNMNETSEVAPEAAVNEAETKRKAITRDEVAIPAEPVMDVPTVSETDE